MNASGAYDLRSIMVCRIFNFGMNVSSAGILDFNSGSGFALMPPLTGGWSDRPLSAGKVSKWAIEFLLLRDPLTPTEIES